MSSASDTSRRSFLHTCLALGGTAVATRAVAGATRAGSVPAASQDLPRTLTATGNANLGTLYADVLGLAEARRYEYSFLGDRFRTLDEFKTTARAKLGEVLAYEPERVDPRPELIDAVDMGDYVRERIVFSTSPHFRVPAYVLVPKAARSAPAPAIVDLHSHGGMYLFGKEKVIDLGEGRNHAAMGPYHLENYEGRPTATALVRRGYVVISIDAFMFGERRLMVDEDLATGFDRSAYSLDDVTRLNARCGAREGTLAKSLVVAGTTWPGIVAWDDMRTVDYLASRPEVDPRRIGCVGVSMGGYRALYLAGLDERIAAACVAGFMSSVQPMLHRHINTHSWVHFLPGLHRWLDLPDVASLMAPKPLLVLQCSRDALFPLAGMQDAVRTLSAVYDKAGADDRFTGRFYDVRHIFNRQMQDDAFAWFDARLKG
jgi:dienelactone hydrolase